MYDKLLKGTMLRPTRRRPDTVGVETPVLLMGSLEKDDRTAWCGRCRVDQPLAGGVRVTPTKWLCSQCWKIRVITRRKSV